MKRYLSIILLLAVLRCYAGLSEPLLLRNEGYPTPIIELKYLNEPFTKELIIKNAFRTNQLVPISIELIKPQTNDAELNDLYLTIESVRVSFAIKETSPLRSALHPGHLVVIPISWPDGFPLEQGSRIVFTVKYNYRLKNEIVETGEIVQQIRF